MNLKSEQLRSDLSLEIDYDQKLSISEIKDRLRIILGKENCSEIKFDSKNLFCYNSRKRKEILLLASITYMGGNGQHPIYKKRMQLKTWYKDVANFYSNKNEYNVRFLGVYHYKNNLIFTEFVKETYLKRKLNSSAAHVFTNDFFQAIKNGIFERLDRNYNKVVTIKSTKLKKYLDGELHIENDLFNIFKMFNRKEMDNKWLTAMDVIPRMYFEKWPEWKQGEWPGWYLEFLFDKYIAANSLERKIKYVGFTNKKRGDLDFDLWFDEDNFFGDLKASDIGMKEAPGNDQDNFLECINKYDKFWYIVYEHETKSDKELNYEATKFRNNFIRKNNEWSSNKEWDEMSYYKRMKHSVKFVKMSVIEINRINYGDVLSEFNQGKQPNGGDRKPKFKITKNNIDNFIVYQETFIEM